LRRSVRVTISPTRYGWDEDHVTFALGTETGEPDSYRETIEADDRDKWITAMEQEMKSLNRNQIWTLVNLTKDSKAIDCRWVFHKKDNEQYKARLVAKGYAQKEVTSHIYCIYIVTLSCLLSNKPY